MKPWIVGMRVLVFGLLGLCTHAKSQSISLNVASGEVQVAPASFKMQFITYDGGSGKNRYRVDKGSIYLFRDGKLVHSGGTDYVESSLPMGRYTYKAIATAMNDVNLHEVAIESAPLTIRVDAPPVPSGGMSATPNPCDIAPGETTCAVTVSWNSANAQNAEVWVTALDSSDARLFASASTGAQVANWITARGARFHLKSGGATLASVDVRGNAPPPHSGTLTATPNPCTIQPGNTDCEIILEWTSKNAPGTRLLGVVEGGKPFGYSSMENGRIPVTLPGSSRQRFYLEFKKHILAEVEVSVGPVPPPNGRISASPCLIPERAVTCTTTINWDSYNTLDGMVVVRRSDLNNGNMRLLSSGSKGSISVAIPTSGNRFHLIQLADGKTLATVDVSGIPSSTGSYTHAVVETTEYRDDAAQWIMGRVKRTVVNDVETSRADFDAKGQPVAIHGFGRLLQKLSYHPDGTVAQIMDGNGNATTFNRWKRGIPQTVGHADGTSQSAVVDDNGWIASVTDETGARTCYAYDRMGRLTSTTYPSEAANGVCDSSSWTPRTSEFRPMTVADWKPPGFTAGQWRRYDSQGNYTKLTYYDALWRPLLIHEYDGLDTAGTMRATSVEYDGGGRVTFQSYPSSDLVPAATGTWRFHDALGRVIQVKQDSELGPLVTATEYLPGFKTRVTNPRGQQTLTIYQTFDQPTYDYPIGIHHPEGAYTEIHRDPFGKVTALRRRDATASEQAWRHYVYQGDRLCKSIEPETGPTVYGYDAAGNLAYTATGLRGFGDTNSCSGKGGWLMVKSRAAMRTYDSRNRVKTLGFPDGKGNQIWTYTPDGLPSTITTYNGSSSTLPVVNVYHYNRRRLLTAETSGQTGWYTWGLGYGYNALGHVFSQNYADGTSVTYAPNALGQPTQVGSYATGVRYYPNGAIKQFSYGSGLIHAMTQNARQLPARSTDSGGALDLDYGYDKHGNVANIIDHTAGARQSRSMIYDGLDRLTQATGDSFGTASYGYNVLDNLTTLRVTAGSQVRDHTYHYDASNRLASVTNTVGGATVVGLSYDVQGNLANKNGQGYTFDFGNRLRDVPGKETYRYDGHGRRVHTGTASYAVWQYALDGRLMYSHDARNNRATNYFYLGNTLLALREVPMNGGGAATVKYQHNDALGTALAESDASGMVVRRSEYEPYGQLVNRPLTDGPGFTGHVQDAASGLIYMQQRYYDALIGRFLSVDPVTAYSGPVANFNRYWYASGNPYRFFDPDGRHVCSGSKADCLSFDKAIGLAKDAAGSSKLTPEQRGSLRAAVDFYGEKGDPKVQVSFGDLKGDYAAISSDKNGRGSAVFDIKEIAKKNPGENGLLNGIAMRALHEGDHGVRIVEEGFPATREDRIQRERTGYRVEAYYQKAMNFLQNGGNMWAPWNPGDGFDEDMINSRANRSVESSCWGYTGGNC